MDQKLYRRRQRRRAVIAWGTLGVIVALVVVGIVFGGEDEGTNPTMSINLFSSEMTSAQYEQIHKGESESLVVSRLDSVGLVESEVEDPDLLRMFPPPPDRSSCDFWTLSDAPDHLVRLCFSEPDDVLAQKSVRAPEESGAETTLV